MARRDEGAYANAGANCGCALAPSNRTPSLGTCSCATDSTETFSLRGPPTPQPPNAATPPKTVDCLRARRLRPAPPSSPLFYGRMTCVPGGGVNANSPCGGLVFTSLVTKSKRLRLPCASMINTRRTW